MKEWLQRALHRLTKALSRIFKPALLGTDNGAVLLVETPGQIITRKLIALALGTLAVSVLTTPEMFAIDEIIATKVGDWLGKIATVLWNYNGVALSGG